MNELSNKYHFKEKHIFYLEWFLILSICFFPLLISLPYRINIFLSWEGAYRLYIGQVPYRDFGLPMGFSYWVIPAVFFKIFGPTMMSLIKAQVLINIISAFVFKKVVAILDVSPVIRLFALFTYLISFTLINYWPWYNHTVYVFELISILFLLFYLFPEEGVKKYKWIVWASVFSFLTFFTKQDAGGLTFVFSLALLIIEYWRHKDWKPLLLYLLVFAGFFGLIALIFARFDFFYWFNFGQFPHSSRLDPFTIFQKVLEDTAYMERFYFLFMVMIVMSNWRNVLADNKYATLLLITFFMVWQSMIIRATSIVPNEHVAFFHSFMFATIFYHRFQQVGIHFLKMCLVLLLIGFWWSGMYLDYLNFFIKKSNVELKSDHQSLEKQERQDWVASDLAAFGRIKMPVSTIKGIENLKKLAATKENLKVLNMSEITPIYEELKVAPPVGIPLWFHKRVILFDKETELLRDQIRKGEYDIVLFQAIPGLDNFFPFDLQEELLKHYELIDTFDAPRKTSEGYSYIQVFRIAN
jgi:hypothetical protein